MNICENEKCTHLFDYLSVSRAEYPNYWQQFVIHFRNELEENKEKATKKKKNKRWNNKQKKVFAEKKNIRNKLKYTRH